MIDEKGRIISNNGKYDLMCLVTAIIFSVLFSVLILKVTGYIGPKEAVAFSYEKEIMTIDLKCVSVDAMGTKIACVMYDTTDGTILCGIGTRNENIPYCKVRAPQQ